MTKAKSAHRTVFLALTFMAVGAATLGVSAADERASTPTPAAAANAADGISAAKRDYDFMKRARSPADLTRADSSAAPAANLSSTNEESSAFLSSDRAAPRSSETKGKTASDHWLIDAMNENRPDLGKTAKTTAQPASANPIEHGDLLANAAAVAASSEAKTEIVAPKPAPATDNPLTTYMASWMTPKDFDLLKAKPADPGISSTPAQAQASSDQPADASNLDHLSRSEPTLNSSHGAANSAPAAELCGNPYLTDFASSASIGGNEIGSTPSAPPVFNPVALPANPAPQNEMAPLKMDAPTSDSLKPSNDSKYFPQLKRF